MDRRSVLKNAGIAGILAAGAALARTAPEGGGRSVLGLTERELVLTLIGIVIAVLAGLAFGGLL